MPAKKPVEVDKYAPTAWSNAAEELTCPSGQVCLVQHPDIAKMAAEGLLNKTDMLTQVVDQKHVSKKAKGGANSLKSQKMTQDMALQNILNDPEKLAATLETMDQIVMATVIKPELQHAPEDRMEWVPGTAYIEAVELNDKLYILQFAVGGTRDVARFLGELTESVDNLANVQAVPAAPQ